jgi:hypothetical protein
MVIADPIKSSISSEPSGRNNPSHIPRIRNDGSFYKMNIRIDPINKFYV